MSNIALIILAAGESKRLGQPKQLLQFNGRTLLRHAVENALQSSCRPIIAVIQNGFEKELQDCAVTIKTNPAFAEGIASSIRLGIQAVPETCDAAVIMLVDQPRITSKHLNNLAASERITATKYNNTLGVPAYFPRQYFPELLSLKGDQGAKSILQKHNATPIDFPAAALDIDTPKDAKELTQLKPFP
jgi:molybdenum cofactor cytidylyltransferase